MNSHCELCKLALFLLPTGDKYVCSECLEKLPKIRNPLPKCGYCERQHTYQYHCGYCRAFVCDGCINDHGACVDPEYDFSGSDYV